MIFLTPTDRRSENVGIEPIVGGTKQVVDGRDKPGHDSLGAGRSLTHHPHIAFVMEAALAE
jgi:hypothetical protein